MIKHEHYNVEPRVTTFDVNWEKACHVI